MKAPDGPERACSSTAEALRLFDRLEPVDLAFMGGSWAGESFPSGHPLEGLLEAFHWHGKRFDSPEEVHPLVFRGFGGGRVCLDPRFIGPLLPWSDRMPWLRWPAAGRAFQLLMPLLATSRPRARLRMTRWRGVVSATMLYDHLPIHDVFRRLDEETVLGLMDRRGMAAPFFFVLRREAGLAGTPGSRGFTSRYSSDGP